MPSSGFVQVDAAHTGVAILDSSFIIEPAAPQSANEDISSLTNNYAKITQSQEDDEEPMEEENGRVVVSPVPGTRKASINFDVDEGEKLVDFTTMGESSEEPPSAKTLGDDCETNIATKHGSAPRCANNGDATHEPTSKVVTPRPSKRTKRSKLPANVTSKSACPPTPEKTVVDLSVGSPPREGNTTQKVAVATPGDEPDNIRDENANTNRKGKGDRSAKSSKSKVNMKPLSSFFTPKSKTSNLSKKKNLNAEKNKRKKEVEENLERKNMKSAENVPKTVCDVIHSTEELCDVVEIDKSEETNKETTKLTKGEGKEVEFSAGNTKGKRPSSKMEKPATKPMSTNKEIGVDETTSTKPLFNIKDDIFHEPAVILSTVHMTPVDGPMSNFILSPDDRSNDSTMLKKLDGAPSAVVAFASRGMSAGPRRVLTQTLRKSNMDGDIKKLSATVPAKKQVTKEEGPIGGNKLKKSDNPCVENNSPPTDPDESKTTPSAEKSLPKPNDISNSSSENSDVSTVTKDRMKDGTIIKEKGDSDPTVSDVNSKIVIDEGSSEMKSLKSDSNAVIIPVMSNETVPAGGSSEQSASKSEVSGVKKFNRAGVQEIAVPTAAKCGDVPEEDAVCSLESTTAMESSETPINIQDGKESRNVTEQEVTSIPEQKIQVVTGSEPDLSEKVNDRVEVPTSECSDTQEVETAMKEEETKQVSKTVSSFKSSKPSPSKKGSAYKGAASEKKGISPITAGLQKLAASSKGKKGFKSKKVASDTNQKQQPSPDDTNITTPTVDKTKACAASTVQTDAGDCKKISTPISAENSTRLQNFNVNRERYVTRAIELGSRPSSDDFEEECLCLHDSDLPSLLKGKIQLGEDGAFPDSLVPCLLVIVQGSSLPLSTLAENALDELSAFVSDCQPLTLESVSTKIKLLAQRKQYLSGHPPPAGGNSIDSPKLDCFENVDESLMWRWEVTSIDLFHKDDSAKVKKARSARRKLQGHHRSIMKLIASIDDAVKLLKIPDPNKSLESALAKVSEAEEKFLKFEREEETKRLKEKSKIEELAEKQKEKERAEEERQQDKKRKEEEKERKAKEREDAKRKKIEEKEQEKLMKKQEQDKKEKKQKARMMSFFSPPSTKKRSRSPVNTLKDDHIAPKAKCTFDSEKFRAMIKSQKGFESNPFPYLAHRRLRKTKRINVSVFVTVLSDNPFAPQPYDEERTITVTNKYKFLGFHEDVRPPYHGTWSKHSTEVTGRRPLGKDTRHLDYDVDSEAEWEEDEDDQGEDCDEECPEDEDDVVQNEEDDNDGWLAADDDLGIEDEDDETREIRKKKINSEAASSSAHSNQFTACVIAPCMGGIPQGRLEDDESALIEGFNPQDAMATISSHMGLVLMPKVNICLDAFPPAEIPDDQGKKEGAVRSSNAQNDSKPSSQDLSMDSLKVIAKFVHNSTYKSKEMLVTELRKAHPDVTASRAQASRELDVIADKRRLRNGGGVVWEVKTDTLNKLDLKVENLAPPPKEIVKDEKAKVTSSNKEHKGLKVEPPKSVSFDEDKACTQVAKTIQNKSKKRARPDVPSASVNLFAKFLKKKKQS